MTIRNNFKRILSLAFAFAVFFSYILASTPVKPLAVTLQEQKQQYASKISSAESEINQLKKEKADKQQIANKLQLQLQDLTNQAYIIQTQRDNVDKEVSSLTSQIKSLSTQIKDTEQKVEDMDTQIEDTVDIFCERMRANYMAGPTSYLDVLMNSKDLSSMLNQIELMKRVTDNDQQLVNKLNSEIEKAEKLKVDLGKQKDDAEKKKTELSNKKVELDASKAEYDSLILNIESKAEEVDKLINGVNQKIASLHEDVNVYKDAQAGIDKAIKDAEKKRSSGTVNYGGGGYSGGGSTVISGGGAAYSNGTVSTSGWMWPVPTGASYISSYYGYRSDPATGATKFHSGLDIAAPGGSNIVATKSGYVVFVNYGNTGYGNHIMIGHSDGTYSLYAHCLANFPVSNGQTVSQGQVIAHVGTSGYSTGYHCHFEIRDSKGNKLDPSTYVHK